MKRRARAGVLVALAVAAACGPRPGWMRPEPQRSWIATLVDAQQAASASRFGTADSLLVGYVKSHPRSPEAAEATYWRAFYLLDPANPKGTPREAAKLFEQYLATNVVLLHEAEAATLRRTAVTVDSLTTVLQTANAATAAANSRIEELSRPKPPAPPDETQKLRDELARTQAELDRIKKRLARP